VPEPEAQIGIAKAAAGLAGFFSEKLSGHPRGWKNPGGRKHFEILWHNWPGDKTIMSIAELKPG